MLVTVDAGTQLQDKEQFIVGDDTQTLTFEFDSDTSPGVEDGNVPVSFTRASTATQIATAIADAIDEAGLHLEVVVDGGTLRVRGQEVVFDFDPEVLPFATVPLFGKNEGVLHQERAAIEVYFNDDPLTDTGTLNTAYFQLITTNNTADTNDDLVYPSDDDQVRRRDEQGPALLRRQR